MVNFKNDKTGAETILTENDIYLTKIAICNFMVDLVNRVKMKSSPFMNEIHIRRQEELLELLKKYETIDKKDEQPGINHNTID